MRLHACSPMIIASSKWKGSGGESTLRNGGSEKRAVGGHEEGETESSEDPERRRRRDHVVPGAYLDRGSRFGVVSA